MFKSIILYKCFCTLELVKTVPAVYSKDESSGGLRRQLQYLLIYSCSSQVRHCAVSVSFDTPFPLLALISLGSLASLSTWSWAGTQWSLAMPKGGELKQDRDSAKLSTARSNDLPGPGALRVLSDSPIFFLSFFCPSSLPAHPGFVDHSTH